MNYTTKNGYELTLGRIPRAVIDAFIMQHPMPEPPMRVVSVFGDIDEEIPDTNDFKYQRELAKWLISFGDKQIGLILPAIEFELDDTFFDLQEIGRFTFEQCVRAHVLKDADDFAHVINSVLYNSTVTQTAIDEATASYNITWFEQDITAFTLPPSPGKYNLLFESREAARFANYSWNDFCKLSGPEQSAIVAHFRLERRLQWLMRRR